MNLSSRLSVAILVTSLVLLFKHTVIGFSILPTSSRRTSSSSLTLSATPEVAPGIEEILARARMAAESTPEEEEEAIDVEELAVFSESILDDMDEILQTMEKRLEEGSGSLSLEEVEEFDAKGNRILVEMKENEAAHAVGASSGGAAAAAPGATPDISELYTAVNKMDSLAVSALLEAGLEMDEETTNAAFWNVVRDVDKAEREDKPISADVPRMLHHIFDADLKHLLSREKISKNITCMQPKLDDMGDKARSMNYIFDDGAHKDLPLSEGRVCEGGTCCDECSRNIFPTFASDAETDFNTFPQLNSFTFNDLKNTDSASIIQFMRLIERVRRTIAHEYGLPLKTILPLQAYSRKYVAGMTQQGGGGGEGDFVILHTDEATHSGYHYSCVMYLSTQGKDFEGGDFVFNDPAPEGEQTPIDENLPLEEQVRRTGRKFTPFHPTKGAAVIFSSGWENMHEVEKITTGTRYAVPCFFTTCPVPDAAYDQMAVGKPKTDEDIADDWLHLLLAHRTENPMEAMGRVKELLMKWHYMCAPLSDH